jgi:hypothetical protein
MVKWYQKQIFGLQHSLMEVRVRHAVRLVPKSLFIFSTILLVNVNVRAVERPLLAGIVQVDGALLPFAEYKDQTWKNTWVIEEAVDGPKLAPIPLSKIPEKWTGYPPQTLSLWYLSSAGKQNTPLRAARARRVPMHCGELWGLETDFPKQTVPERTFPVKKAGVAFTTSQKFSGINAVEGETKIIEKISAFVKTTFDPLDQNARKDYSDVANASSMDISKLMKSEKTIDNKYWYYVEAKRMYGKKPETSDYSCPRISFLTGWIEETSAGKLRFIGKSFYSTDCDMKEVRTDSPSGILSLDNRLYLFSQANGYEGESYSISAIDPDGIHSVLEGSGGGC